MPTTSLPTVLLIEDSPTLSLLYKGYLRHEDIQLCHSSTGAEGLAFIDGQCPDVVVLDLNLPDMEGMDILKVIQKQNLPCAAIVITAYGSIDVAVDAMRYGAFDFIEKPFSGKRLLVTLRNALNSRSLQRQIEQLSQDFRPNYHGFIGSSLAMQRVYRIIDSAAPSKATVFITGESGTGKEVCAEAIHQQSPRSKQPFIALNCAAIPRDLMESEIFGHVKGAFTGASGERKGAAEQADGGTFFLDEICEMDIDLQAKLLRFIQTGKIQKVGGTGTKTVDLRFICATNRNPLDEVAAGRFREDLFYRLHVIPLHLPPLRERSEDVLLIARQFLQTYSTEEHKEFVGLSPECEAIFTAYPWLGNIRELQNVMRNIVVLNQGQWVEAEMLPEPLRSVRPQPQQLLKPHKTAQPDTPPPPQEILPLWQVEKTAIENALRYCQDNIPNAAALLEVSPSTIYRKIQGWQKNGQDTKTKP
ncbi:sigma-54-dependent transcriptional regulator [Methylovulum psychrotolerans]|jgi:DNA-binding NtrC family response regulator|uniref:Sigma-54-dependent Fis family transcriptional regulator n=1 Tax=Methylovulum psychrotolerans TaxID=1704499 RepID=A0A1Z4C0A3_9GAMM|nr:sigma-54 dependent transcriptional regulator [Methylovulum psychrotolerans]ASF46968.1 sigma-54-dependent Fis family transcriptional regulator [Methylovulum psychrotolerans]POZ52839.1 sigma-54-dependent Fis family transcriptional regulator [Methylovulum psychrotolerans]